MKQLQTPQELKIKKLRIKAENGAKTEMGLMGFSIKINGDEGRYRCGSTNRMMERTEKECVE